MYNRFFRDRICFVFLPLTCLYLEVVLKLWCFDTFNLKGFIFTALLSIAVGFAATLLCCCFENGFATKLYTAILLAITLLFGTQAVYHGIFRAFVTVYSITQAGEVFGSFWREALQGIFASSGVLIPIFIPFVLWLIFKKKIVPANEIRTSQRAFLCGAFCIFQIIATSAIMGNSSGVISTGNLYTENFVPDLSVSYFGALTTFRIDLREFIETELNSDYSIINSVDTEPNDTNVYIPQELAENSDSSDLAANILEIDFDALIENSTDSTIKEMHQYFSSVEPTIKNEYTGMFEGKNLVWIVAEAFSSLAIDEVHTPTLYKLSNSGFVFDNFYNPIWGVSTSDGEYVTMTGLIPKTGIWTYSKSSQNYMPFGFGNLLTNDGYSCFAYHDHDYTYYDRNLSHPNMGYNYKGVGNGLNVTNQWPASDLEMIQNTVGEYIDDSPFHVYYMTVSGHLFYNFTTNQMAKKHMEDVADLPYSESARAYVACNMEFDLAVEELINQLDEAGVLDDTVIVISGDHYPYGLEMSEIEELHGSEIKDNFQLYKSTLIVWNSQMDEPIEVEKPCSSLDIMPTIANLFGLSYDSRLVMGRDILSDSPALVFFANRSFLTDKGRYDSCTDVFTPADELGWSEEEGREYATSTLENINNMFHYSAAILDNNYYEKVLNK